MALSSVPTIREHPLAQTKWQSCAATHQGGKPARTDLECGPDIRLKAGVSKKANGLQTEMDASQS
jgi:hypothetical protein